MNTASTPASRVVVGPAENIKDGERWGAWARRVGID
jgi:hypothetical protein